MLIFKIFNTFYQIVFQKDFIHFKVCPQCKVQQIAPHYVRLSSVSAFFGQSEIGAKWYFKTHVSLVCNELTFPPMSCLLNLDFIFVRAVRGLKIWPSVKLILKNS